MPFFDEGHALCGWRRPKGQSKSGVLGLEQHFVGEETVIRGQGSEEPERFGLKRLSNANRLEKLTWAQQKPTSQNRL